MGSPEDREASLLSVSDIDAVIRLTSDLTLRSPSRGQRVSSLMRNLKQLLRSNEACAFESRGQAVGVMLEMNRDGWMDWQSHELSNHLSGRTLSEMTRQPITMEWPEGGSARKRTPRYHCLASCLPAGVNYFITLAFARKTEPFTDREIALLWTVHRSELMSLVSPTRAPDTAALSGRLREVLARLMNGDSEKQIAGRLQLSRHTIHAHVKTIYRRYKVNSRGELLSLSVDPVERQKLMQR